MRRGYDLHLHYANFGMRTLMIRLPNGPLDAKAAKPYFALENLRFLKDKQGRGGVICLEPCFEAGQLDDLWGIDEIVDRLVPVRAELLNGDMRPLYLAHLAAASDCNNDPDEIQEAPVPAGLKKLADAQQALAELYELDESLIAAAAQRSPVLTKHNDTREVHAEWLKCQSEEIKSSWLAQLLAEPHSTVRAEILSEFRKDNGTSSWPTAPASRTISELRAAAELLQQEADHRKSSKKNRPKPR